MLFLVERMLQPYEAAAKVTRMILELDQAEILHLIESPAALKAKVVQMVRFLREIGWDQSEN